VLDVSCEPAERIVAQTFMSINVTIAAASFARSEAGRRARDATESSSAAEHDNHAPKSSPAETEKSAKPETNDRKDTSKGAPQSGRVTTPVPGLYDSVDPNVTPPGWKFVDDGPHAHEDHPNWVRVITDVRAPDGTGGRIDRSYDPKAKMLVMENAFLSDVPSWIDAGKPLKENKGTPTVTYLTLRQMKLLGAKFGETKVVKMSTIQNIEAVMQLEQMKRNGVPYEQGVAKTHSVDYASTSIQQSGQMITDVRIDTSGAFQWELSDMMNHFRMPRKERDALFSKYGLTQNDVVMANYDIYIDVAPYPAAK
jgi:hypothetical protein